MAVIGTGRMGGAMASSIVRGGFDVVLWNRDPSKSERLAVSLDMPVAATAAEAASKADVVVTSLADDAAEADVSRRRVHRLALPGRRPVAEAVVGRAQVRPALDHLAREALAG